MTPEDIPAEPMPVREEFNSTRHAIKQLQMVMEYLEWHGTPGRIEEAVQTAREYLECGQRGQ